jgi:hypothetical protein
VADHLDPRITGLSGAVCRTVRGRVVDDVDAVDELRYRGECSGDQSLFVVSGDDDPYALTLKHF